MANEPVLIKGTREGVTIVLNKSQDFEKAKNAIYKKLKNSKDFFAGGTAHLKINDGELNKEEYSTLKKLLLDFDMNLQEASSPKTLIFPKPNRSRVLLLKKTIRSGQKISYNGTVVIVGDVNPGSEIIATGDILIMGNLRGLAHAGAKGDKTSIVAAFRLQPTQIRIANYISRPPEGKKEVPQFPEIARLKERGIVIEPYNVLNTDIYKRKTGGD